MSYSRNVTLWISFSMKCPFTSIYIHFACLSVCLLVCLYSINVKTAEPIGPKFWLNYENIRHFFYKIRKLLFVFVLQCIKDVYNWKSLVFVKCHFDFALCEISSMKCSNTFKFNLILCIPKIELNWNTDNKMQYLLLFGNLFYIFQTYAVIDICNYKQIIKLK